MEKVRIKKLNENAFIPTYGSEFSAGADLYACLEESVTIAPGEAGFISTGICAELPEGTVGLVFARSGMAVKRGLAPSNKVGVIDSDYRGEIKVSLFNQSKEPRLVENGERIAQLVIVPYIKADFAEAEELSRTDRGSGGFGSTGK